ncbi:MAG TPA: helix-turn-helix domain-containing protein [bacterium]|jgi:DNA-binding HxlR family transcriptional regulator|nr:helix-turn-helix domain-containing protein [bacterium]
MLYRGGNLEVRLGGRTFHCALDVTMAFVGGKWKTVVLWYLRDKPLRFGELRRRIPEITEKMLSLQLKKLERDGLVLRKAYAEVPPRVEYALTAEGKTLRPLLSALAAWGRRKGKKDGTIVKGPAGRGPKKIPSP